MMIATQDVYRDPAVVSAYAQADYLEPAERHLLNLLLNSSPQFRMLDIAVGAGRTTAYFAPCAGDYVGIDFSPEMISACRQRYGDSLPNARFYVSDMRQLEWLEDKSSDFILISYNAVSALQHEERLQLFAEMKRICSESGCLYFSAHNTLSLHCLFGVFDLFKKLSVLHPQRSYWELRKWWLRRIVYNPISAYQQAQACDYMLINDGAEAFRLQMYYIKPRAQLGQLSPYFNYQRVFDRAGHDVTELAALNKIDDSWLFYLVSNSPLIH